MVKNRLEELQNNAKHGQMTEEEEMEPLQKLEKERKKKPPTDKMDDFECFLERMKDLVEKIEKVKSNVAEIKKLQKELLNSTVKEDAKERRLNDLIAENRNFGSKVKSDLKTEQDYLEKISTSPKKMTSTKQQEHRVKKTQIQANSSRFLEIWQEYNNSQVEYRDKTKRLLVKRCKITNNEYTDDQIETMLDEGNTAIFAKSILDQERLARSQLSELQDRHDEFIKLERSIVEIHDMFMDIGNLVSEQGQMINNIEMNVNSAVIDVEEGKGHLEKARDYAKKALKKKICLISTLIIVGVILLCILLDQIGFFGLFKSDGTTRVETVERIVYVTVTPSTTTSPTVTTSPTNLIPDGTTAVP